MGAFAYRNTLNETVSNAFAMPPYTLNAEDLLKLQVCWFYEPLHHAYVYPQRYLKYIELRVHSGVYYQYSVVQHICHKHCTSLLCQDRIKPFFILA